VAGARYLRDVTVPSELPVNFSAFRRQQHRWTRGSLECAVRLIPWIWKQAVPGMVKLEAVLHLSGYAVHLLLCAVALLHPLVLDLSPYYRGLVTLFGIGGIFSLPALAPTFFFIVAQQQISNRWWRKLHLILFVSPVGAGMMMNTVPAGRHALRGKRTTFERTPKFGITDGKGKWWQRRYQLRLDRIVFFELGSALFSVGTALYALWVGHWGILLCSVFRARSFVHLGHEASASVASSPTSAAPAQDISG
jgi:hypothetical protein